MLVTEFRVTLPISVEEYQVGQLYCVAEASLHETGGGEGVEVLKNEPYDNFPLLGGKFTSGQYTKKIYHLDSKVPQLVRWVAPKGSLQIVEEAWNAYPYCRTVLTNPGYMKDKFIIKVESYHLPDRGEQENVHQLSPALLKQRKVDRINIAHDAVVPSDYKSEFDPKLFQPQFNDEKNASRGIPDLSKPDWSSNVDTVMTAYKLVTVEFKWYGLQGRVETFTLDQERRLFLNFNRQVWCSFNKWGCLNMKDIRRIEDETKEKLAEQRKKGPVQGTKP